MRTTSAATTIESVGIEARCTFVSLSGSDSAPLYAGAATAKNGGWPVSEISSAGILTSKTSNAILDSVVSLRTVDTEPWAIGPGRQGAAGAIYLRPNADGRHRCPRFKPIGISALP
jgi:hypothetical protein